MTFCDWSKNIKIYLSFDFRKNKSTIAPHFAEWYFAYKYIFVNFALLWFK